MNLKQAIAKTTLITASILLVAGCDQKKTEVAAPPPAGGAKKGEYTFAMVAKSAAGTTTGEIWFFYAN